MTHTDIMFQLVFLRKKIELVLEWLFNQKTCKKNRIKKYHWPNMETTSLVIVELVLLPTSDKRWVIFMCQSQVEWLFTVNHLLIRRQCLLIDLGKQLQECTQKTQMNFPAIDFSLQRNYSIFLIWWLWEKLGQIEPRRLSFGDNKKQFNVVSTLTRKKEVVVLRLREIVVARSFGLNMTSVLVVKYGDVSNEQRTMEINVWEKHVWTKCELGTKFQFFSRI